MPSLRNAPNERRGSGARSPTRTPNCWRPSGVLTITLKKAGIPRDYRPGALAAVSISMIPRLLRSTVGAEAKRVGPRS
jgi:hypothetical protein